MTEGLPAALELDLSLLYNTMHTSSTTTMYHRHLPSDSCCLRCRFYMQRSTYNIQEVHVTVLP